MNRKMVSGWKMKRKQSNEDGLLIGLWCNGIMIDRCSDGVSQCHSKPYNVCGVFYVLYLFQFSNAFNRREISDKWPWENASFLLIHNANARRILFILSYLVEINNPVQTNTKHTRTDDWFTLLVAVHALYITIFWLSNFRVFIKRFSSVFMAFWMSSSVIFSCDSYSKRFRWLKLYGIFSAFYSSRDAINHFRDLKIWRFISDHTPARDRMVRTGSIGYCNKYTHIFFSHKTLATARLQP